MIALPAWSSDLLCETRCEACQRPLFLTLPDILQAQPVRCACGQQHVTITPPGLPEINALLVTLEYAANRRAALSLRARARR